MSYDNDIIIFYSFFDTPRYIIYPPEYSADYAGMPEAAAKKIPLDAGADIRERRERIALRARLDSAIRNEDYETAALLRDKIKETEK